MEYLASVIFFGLVIAGFVFLRSRKIQKSNPVLGGGSPMPEGERESDGTVNPKTGPAAE